MCEGASARERLVQLSGLVHTSQQHGRLGSRDWSQRRRRARGHRPGHERGRRRDDEREQRREHPHRHFDSLIRLVCEGATPEQRT